MNTLKAINIKWDIDDDEVSLPTEVKIPLDIIEEGNETSVADYLSDNYAWTVISFDLIEVK